MKTVQSYSGLLALSLCLTLMFSCEKDNPDEPHALSIDELSGHVQKGPFLNGTSITVAELNADMGQTGKNFSTQISDNRGSFELKKGDLNARSVGLPLYKYLGAVVLDKVPAYGSGGYYLPGKSNEDLANEMLDFVNNGYDAVKIKVGNLSPAEEEERLRVVREAIGPDIHLMLDANNAWADLPTAMLYVSRFEKFNPYWIEEPFLPDDIDNHAALAQRTSMMVATGEIEAGRWRFKEILDKRAAAIVQADAIVCGGISEFRKIAATAASYGVPVAPHAWHDVHVHLVASTVNASYVEFMPDDHIVNFRRLIDIQIKARDGFLLLPDRPGLGFSFDPAAVEKFGVRAPGSSTPWLKVE